MHIWICWQEICIYTSYICLWNQIYMHLSVFQFAIILVHKHSSPGFMLKPVSKFLTRDSICWSVRHFWLYFKYQKPFQRQVLPSYEKTTKVWNVHFDARPLWLMKYFMSLLFIIINTIIYHYLLLLLFVVSSSFLKVFSTKWMMIIFHKAVVVWADVYPYILIQTHTWWEIVWEKETNTSIYGVFYYKL